MIESKLVYSGFKNSADGTNYFVGKPGQKLLPGDYNCQGTAINNPYH